MHMISLARVRETMMRMPRLGEQDFAVDRDAARAVIAPVRRDGRTLLMEAESKALLSAYGVRVAETAVAGTPEEAGRLVGRHAFGAGRPGGLRAEDRLARHHAQERRRRRQARHSLGRGGPCAPARTCCATVGERQPEARLQGIAVQPMIERKGAHELIAGIARDAAFGPVILFGAGGTAVEVLDDKAVDLPPLDDLLARAMISRTRVSRLLAGYRHRPPADLDAISETLIRLARMAEDLPEIAELDINPLLADADGVVALDARVVLTDPGSEVGEGAEHLAIAPYPEGWRQELPRPERPPDPSAADPADGRKALSGVLRKGDGARHPLPPLRRAPAFLAYRLRALDPDRLPAGDGLRGDRRRDGRAARGFAAGRRRRLRRRRSSPCWCAATCRATASASR